MKQRQPSLENRGKHAGKSPDPKINDIDPPPRKIGKSRLQRPGQVASSKGIRKEDHVKFSSNENVR